MGVCSGGLLAETNYAILVYHLLPSLFSKVQKTPSLGLKSRTVFQGFGLVSVISWPKQTIVSLGILLRCWVSELQKLFSPGLKPRPDFHGCGIVSKRKKTASLGLQTTIGFLVCNLCSYNLLAETMLVLALFFYHA